MMKKSKLAVLGLVVGLFTFAGIAEAGTSYTSYSTSVGKFNGNGYTAYQTKTTTGATGNLRSTSVGGKYTVDARMQASSGTGSWVRSVNSNETRNLSNSVSKGSSARVQFSNDLSTPVAVQVSGTWRSN